MTFDDLWALNWAVCLKTASISWLQVFILFQVGLTHKWETQKFRTWIRTDRSDIPAHSNNVMMKHQLMSTALCCPMPFLRWREGFCFPCPKYFNTQEVTGRNLRSCGGDSCQTCSTFTFPSDWTSNQDCWLGSLPPTMVMPVYVLTCDKSPWPEIVEVIYL